MKKTLVIEIPQIYCFFFSFVSSNEKIILEFSDNPEIEKIDPLVKVEEGKLQSLKCAAKGYPKPDVKWFFASDRINFVEITNRVTSTSKVVDGYSIHVSSELNFGANQISRMDTGNYKCIFSNSETDFEKLINVTVFCKC